jgi:hypothetical protein
MGDPSVRRSGIFQFLALLLAGGALSAGTVQAKKKPPPQPPPPALAAHINDLAKQLPGVLLEDAGPITGEIQKLVVNHLAEWMANRTPTDVQVRRELESAFSLLHYPLSGDPAVFATLWKGGMVIGAGYTLGWTNFNKQNVVAIFYSQEGKSRLATVTNFTPYTDLHYEMLPAQGWDDLRFFIYGFRPGKSQLRLTAILYSFDGENLKSLWETHDAYDGKMEVQKDKVVIRYLREDEYIREVTAKRKPPRHEAVYLITPKGLKFQDDHEIPF